MPSNVQMMYASEYIIQKCSMKMVLNLERVGEMTKSGYYDEIWLFLYLFCIVNLIVTCSVIVTTKILKCIIIICQKVCLNIVEQYHFGFMLVDLNLKCTILVVVGENPSSGTCTRIRTYVLRATLILASRVSA